jgi:hypothetical protein
MFAFKRNMTNITNKDVIIDILFPGLVINTRDGLGSLFRSDSAKSKYPKAHYWYFSGDGITFIQNYLADWQTEQGKLDEARKKVRGGITKFNKLVRDLKQKITIIPFNTWLSIDLLTMFVTHCLVKDTCLNHVQEYDNMHADFILKCELINNLTEIQDKPETFVSTQECDDMITKIQDKYNVTEQIQTGYDTIVNKAVSVLPLIINTLFKDIIHYMQIKTDITNTVVVLKHFISEIGLKSVESDSAFDEAFKPRNRAFLAILQETLDNPDFKSVSINIDINGSSQPFVLRDFVRFIIERHLKTLTPEATDELLVLDPAELEFARKYLHILI